MPHLIFSHYLKVYSSRSHHTCEVPRARQASGTLYGVKAVITTQLIPWRALAYGKRWYPISSFTWLTFLCRFRVEGRSLCHNEDLSTAELFHRGIQAPSFLSSIKHCHCRLTYTIINVLSTSTSFGSSNTIFIIHYKKHSLDLLIDIIWKH